MRSAILAGAAASAIVGGLTLAANPTLGVKAGAAGAPVPFVDPMELARAACGDDPLSARDRRRFFVRLGGAAHAATKPSAPVSSPTASPRLSPFGGIGYAITTEKKSAQDLFDAGLAHMWNFNHGQAIAAFQAAIAVDPTCAMCAWGEAFAWGPNINAPMDEAANAPAYAAMRKAVSLKENASDKEKALIDALAKRYKKNPPKDRTPLDAAFADAMGTVAKKYADDDFVLAVAAEANMDTQPWDYWQADGRTAKGRTARTLDLLETALKRNPAHIPSIHLYIHATEATTNPYRAVGFADRLDDLSPGLGHLIHMPSHVYYRVGRFKDSLEINNRAVAADEAFLAGGPANPFYEFGYYVHNVHFVMTSAMMAGDVATALPMAKKLDDKLPAAMAVAVPFAQPIKAAPYYAYAQYEDPQTVLALAKPTDEAPFLVAAWRYARGEALARLGRADDARAEAAAIAKTIETADFAAMAEVNIPAADILRVAHHTVLARAADVDGDLGAAIAHMEEAVALQATLNYTEPPYWYYPAKQTLAAMVLRDGDAARAEQLFLEALVSSPNNGWTLHGLAEAYAAQGDDDASDYARALAKKAWLGADGAPELARL